MVKSGPQSKKFESFTVGVERGAGGFSAAWCLDLPGCYTLVPPGGDPADRIALAILEFTAWAHQRSADRLTIDAGQVEVVQSVETGEDLRNGDTSAFFLHDGEPPNAREFPTWANPHDRALDELRDLALAMPAALQSHRSMPPDELCSAPFSMRPRPSDSTQPNSVPGRAARAGWEMTRRCGTPGRARHPSAGGVRCSARSARAPRNVVAAAV